MVQETESYIMPTSVLDSDHPEVSGFVRRICRGAADQTDMAQRLFVAVSDDIAYNPYSPFYKPGHYRASNVLERGQGYCVQKACLLCAVFRAAGIPSRLGFATIRNNAAPREIVDAMGTDLFVYHGYVEAFVQGRWVKATPAFDKSVCDRFDIDQLVFDGVADAVFPGTNRSGSPFVDYVEYYGTWADLPLDELLAKWREVYGEKRISEWIDAFESGMADGWKP
ncbi:MAG: transglutaminase-like domain-containing protein [Desulfatibacillaceae bacterium]